MCILFLSQLASFYLFIQLLFLFENIHVRQLLHKLYAEKRDSLLVLLLLLFFCFARILSEYKIEWQWSKSN